MPYEELSESEKEYDRSAALETLKAMIAMRYRVEKGWPSVPYVARNSANQAGYAVSVPENPTSPVASPVMVALPCREPIKDDMDDSQGMPAAEPLHGILQHCQEASLPTYQKVDGAALRFQKKYRRRAMAVPALGTAAVVLVVTYLPFS